MSFRDKHGIIFDNDELSLNKPKAGETANDIYKRGGIYFLKDVIALYELPASIVNKIQSDFNGDSKKMWEQAGLRKMWNHWQIRVMVFHPYFKKNLAPPYLVIPHDIDGNKMLNLNGTYRLADVCAHIPFNPQQLRYQARVCKGDSKTELGIYKDGKDWVVDMKRFKPYIEVLWQK